MELDETTIKKLRVLLELNLKIFSAALNHEKSGVKERYMASQQIININYILDKINGQAKKQENYNFRYVGKGEIHQSSSAFDANRTKKI